MKTITEFLRAFGRERRAIKATLEDYTAAEDRLTATFQRLGAAAREATVKPADFFKTHREP